MAKARLSFLTHQERELIHSCSLEVLREIGVSVRSTAVLRLLEAYGATVDFEASIARIPEGIVDRALSTAPRQITLCARNPEQDLELPARDLPYVATNGLAVFVKDLDSGEIRNSNRADLARFTRLADALEAVDFLWTAP